MSKEILNRTLTQVAEKRLSKEEIATLLLFWSGSSAPPPFGFVPVPGPVDIDAQWTIARSSSFSPHNTNSAAEARMQEQRLPEASTCDRRLSLPEYPNADVLHARLKTALELGCIGYDRV